MNHINKPNPQYKDKRVLRISYVPEQLIGKYSTLEWVQQFERRLKFLDVDTELVENKEEAGSHKDEKKPIEIRENYTDFLVVFTLDYSEAYSKRPPEQLVTAIYNRNCLCDSDTPLIMWILKLHPDDFRVTDFGKHPWWHQLIGTEYQGRFKSLEKEGWDNEQTKAAQLISDHSSCKKHSPVCPNHQTTKPDNPHLPALLFVCPNCLGGTAPQ